jgi:hypothetical protein
MMPQYPIYVPTKGRYDSRLTIKALQRLGLKFFAVVEPQEYARYALEIDSSRILVVPHRDCGVVATRNWIWDHALASGIDRYWTMDDNIKAFYRFNRNLKVPMACPNFLVAIESFVDRYENVPVAGMNYDFFCKQRDPLPPYYLNRQVYSNMLIETRAPYRFEGFYNEDTDLCLRILKNGLCTIKFNAFLIGKATTMTVGGGNTPYYQGDGRLKMARELRDKHPDVTRISHKFGHWQHHVDYRSFKSNRLKQRAGAVVKPGIDNFGMVLKHYENEAPDARQLEWLR